MFPVLCRNQMLASACPWCVQATTSAQEMRGLEHWQSPLHVWTREVTVSYVAKVPSVHDVVASALPLPWAGRAPNSGSRVCITKGGSNRSRAKAGEQSRPRTLCRAMRSMLCKWLWIHKYQLRRGQSWLKLFFLWLGYSSPVQLRQLRIWNSLPYQMLRLAIWNNGKLIH